MSSVSDGAWGLRRTCRPRQKGTAALVERGLSLNFDFKVLEKFPKVGSQNGLQPADHRRSPLRHHFSPGRHQEQSRQQPEPSGSQKKAPTAQGPMRTMTAERSHADLRPASNGRQSCSSN